MGEMTLEERVARLERKAGIAFRYCIAPTGADAGALRLCKFDDGLCFRRPDVYSNAVSFADKGVAEGFLEHLRDLGFGHALLVREDA